MIWVSTISSCLSDGGIGAGKCPNGHVVSREPPTVILDAMDRVCTEDGKATKKLDLRCYRLPKPAICGTQSAHGLQKRFRFRWPAHGFTPLRRRNCSPYRRTIAAAGSSRM